jgi:DNA-binding NarL/FixJ family response regulator
MGDNIRLAVVDDHPLLREGVVQILSSCPDVEVLAQGASAKEALAIAGRLDPDVMVLDISIPGGGLEALEAIVAAHPKTKVVMLTVSINEQDVVGALRLGACGYVVKGVSGPELIHAIRSVFNGDHFLSPALGARLITEGVGRKPTVRGDLPKTLSHREAEILRLVRLGLSNKAIGAKLQLSDKTVKHYMTNLFQKLNVRSRLEAAVLLSAPSGNDTETANEQSVREER